MSERLFRPTGFECRSPSPLRPHSVPTPSPLRTAQLPYIHMPCMFSHMKTTLNIDDRVMARLRSEAARQGKTMSELVETALRRLLIRQSAPEALPPLPKFKAGRASVDIANREALYSLMEER